MKASTSFSSSSDLIAVFGRESPSHSREPTRFRSHSGHLRFYSEHRAPHPDSLRRPWDEGWIRPHRSDINARLSGNEQILLIGFAGNREILIDQAFLVKFLEEFHRLHIFGEHKFGSQFAVLLAPVIWRAEPRADRFERTISGSFRSVSGMVSSLPLPSGSFSLNCFSIL